MKKEILRLECLKVAVQEGFTGKKAIPRAKEFYDFVMGIEKQPHECDCEKEVMLVKRRCRIPYSSDYGYCLCNADTGEIVDFLPPEQGEK